MILPLAVFYFLVFSPKSTEIDLLNSSISSLEIELKNVKSKAAKIEEQKALMREVEIKFKEASVVIPDNKEIPSLLKTISSQGTGAGLDILTFVPGSETPKLKVPVVGFT